MMPEATNSGISIKNWNRFQHFKNRKPPWIKLYRDLLDDPNWNRLDGTSAKVLVMLWLLASEKEGNLPDIPTLAFRLRMNEAQIKKAIADLSPWLRQDDINMISSRYQHDTPERETEGEEERELETETDAKTSYGEFKNVKLKPSEHEKLVDTHGETDVAIGITILDAYIASKGKKYMSHYATMNSTSWVWDRVKQEKEKKNGRSSDVGIDRELGVTVLARDLMAESG